MPIDSIFEKQEGTVPLKAMPRYMQPNSTWLARDGDQLALLAKAWEAKMNRIIECKATEKNKDN